MSKEIDILTVLYPSGIVAKDICEVYETVMPKIRQLIDGVAVGYAHTGTLPKTTDVLSKVPDTLPKVTGQVIDAEIDAELPSDISYTDNTDKTVCDDLPNGKGTFVGSDRHNETDWHEEKYKNSRYFKNGDDVVIRTGDSRIDTTWRYLCEFFDGLSDETKLSAIVGINRTKRAALIDFYEAHPNFACKTVKDGSTKIFKKVDVRVSMATHGEGEPIAAADYEISAY